MRPDSPIFIGGAGRSGTTLLRLIFDSHSRIACGPELKVLPSICQLRRQCIGAAAALSAHQIKPNYLDGLFIELILGLLEPYRLSRHKARVAEKTPHNVLYFDVLGKLFTDAPLIHVIRDGRDVVASLLRQDWIDGVTGSRVAYTKDARSAASYWRHVVSSGRAYSQLPNYIEVRYERLVLAPEETLRDLFERIGEKWEPSVLDFAAVDHDQPDGEAAVAGKISADKIGGFRKQLSPFQFADVMAEAHKELEQLGYLDKEAA